MPQAPAKRQPTINKTTGSKVAIRKMSTRQNSSQLSKRQTPQEKKAESTDSLTVSQKSTRNNDILHNVYNVDPQASGILGHLKDHQRVRIMGAKGVKLVDGKCSNCDSQMDLESIKEYAPEKKMLKKFESLMLGRQRTLFGNIMKEVGQKVKNMER